MSSSRRAFPTGKSLMATRPLSASLKEYKLRLKNYLERKKVPLSRRLYFFDKIKMN